jgi:hypothetical protein
MVGRHLSKILIVITKNLVIAKGQAENRKREDRLFTVPV